MLLHTFDLLLAYLQIVSMLKNRFELVKNMMQIIHITFIFICKYQKCAFQVWFGLFLNVLYVWGFLLFSVFFSR